VVDLNKNRVARPNHHICQVPASPWFFYEAPGFTAGGFANLD